MMEAATTSVPHSRICCVAATTLHPFLYPRPAPVGVSCEAGLVGVLSLRAGGLSQAGGYCLVILPGA